MRVRHAALFGVLLTVGTIMGLVGCGMAETSLRTSMTSEEIRTALTDEDFPSLGLTSADELLVIEGRERRQGRPAQERVPRGGQLRAKLSDNKTVPFPLKHTDVKARITYYVGSVTVKQQYHNPYDSKIEAVYVFPLPDDGAVRDFLMTIGDRTIRGIIREREEARRIYHEARRRGHVASLLTQERPNIFTQSVANIEPGKQVDISITYFHTLRYADGFYEFVFPMVVGPRFNPPGSTDGVGAVPVGGQGTSGQKTEIQYLHPTEISSHDIALEVDLDAGVPIEKLESPSHSIEVKRPEPSRAEIRLSPDDRIPNKDFVLRYRVTGEEIRAALATYRDKTGGYFTLMLQPPADLAEIPAAPREMIFVLDCSGSMSGAPIAAAKRSLEKCLRRLSPNDTFQIIRFSEGASALGSRPIRATPANIRKGIRYVQRLRGSGGTMMIEGIKAALDFPHDPERFRIVSFMTDGFIGNDRQIIGEVRRRIGSARIFSFGVGSSPNRYLLEGMARAGRGVSAYVMLDQASEKAANELYRRIEHPALTDIRIDWGALDAHEVNPAPIPDLFVGRPVVLAGRFRGEGEATVRVSGRVGGRPFETRLTVNPEEPGLRHQALASIWARAKIARLYDAMTWSATPAEEVGMIRTLALEYGLMSDWTAFVAVDSLSRTSGDHGTTVPVPVPVPKGVRYETTVPGRGPGQP